jgi:hypothetical protein
MPIENALNVVDEVCAKFMGSRADHQVINAALASITDTIKGLQTEVLDLRNAAKNTADVEPPAQA